MAIRKLNDNHPLRVIQQDLLEEIQLLKKNPAVVEPETLDPLFDDFFAEFEKDDRSPKALATLAKKHKEAVSAFKKRLRDTKLAKVEQAILDRFNLFEPKDEAYNCAREALRLSTKDANKNAALRKLGSDLLDRIDHYHENNTKMTSPENDEKKAAENNKHKETFTQLFKCLKIGIDTPQNAENPKAIEGLAKLLPKKQMTSIGRIMKKIGIFLIVIGAIVALSSLTLIIMSHGGALPVVAAPLILSTLCIIAGIAIILKRYTIYAKQTSTYEDNLQLDNIKYQLGMFRRHHINPPAPEPDANAEPEKQHSAGMI